METVEQQGSEMMKEVAQAREEARRQARGEASPADSAVAAVAVAAEEAPVVAAEETPAVVEEAEEIIRIGDKEFKTQAEAIKYAESLESDKLVSEAYNQGMRDTLQQSQAQVAPPPPEEDKFDEEFYTNPKEKLKKIKDEAIREALATVQAEQRKENLWGQFLNENPDIERRDAERILNENFETIGKMTDVAAAMKVLATKTRAEYQRMAERLAPRKELPNRGGQAVSTGNSNGAGVTPQKKVEKPLDMFSQLRSLRKR